VLDCTTRPPRTDCPAIPWRLVRRRERLPKAVSLPASAFPLSNTPSLPSATGATGATGALDSCHRRSTLEGVLQTDRHPSCISSPCRPINPRDEPGGVHTCRLRSLGLETLPKPAVGETATARTGAGQIWHSGVPRICDLAPRQESSSRVIEWHRERIERSEADEEAAAALVPGVSLPRRVRAAVRAANGRPRRPERRGERGTRSRFEPATLGPYAPIPVH
jgi:hypothetical protein